MFQDAFSGGLFLTRLFLFNNLMPFSMNKRDRLFYSTTPSFIIYEISQVEFKFYSKIIDNYYQYVIRHPFTFLSRIIGLFELSDPLRYFIVEKNIFDEFYPTDSSFNINIRTDATQNGLQRPLKKRPIQLGYSKKFQLLEQLELDSIVNILYFLKTTCWSTRY